jgi:hypothetical protein
MFTQEGSLGQGGFILVFIDRPTCINLFPGQWSGVDEAGNMQN